MPDTYTTRALYERLLAEGFEPSADAQRLFEAMTSGQTPDEALAAARADLRAAMLAGDDAATQAAQVAVGDASNIRAAWDTLEQTRADYARAICDAIGESAFDHVRALYNATGSDFEKALATVDPNTPPDTMMRDATKAERDAWVSVPELAARLDRLAALLGDVVRDTGSGRARSYVRNNNPAVAHFPLYLLVTLKNAHPRRIVEALCWIYRAPAHVNPQPLSELDRIAGGRGGRWAAIVHFGASPAVPFDRLADYYPTELEPQSRDSRGKLFDPYDAPENQDENRAVGSNR